MSNKININDTIVQEKEFEINVNNKIVFVFQNVPFKKITIKKWKNIKFEKGQLENEKNNNEFMTVIINREFSEMYKELISLWNREEDFYDFHNRWSTLLTFDKDNFNFTKFRGDFAELMFLYQYGGTKKEDTSESDIYLNNTQYEVKSVSNHTWIFHVSHRQIVNDNPIILFVLEESTKEGMNIIELANKINGNEHFVEYIEKTYRNELYITKKFKITKGKIYIKPKIDKNVKVFFKSAKYVVDSNFQNLEYFNDNKT